MKKVLVFDGEKCVACKICELVCSFNVTGEYNPKRAFIKILSNPEFCVFIPVLNMGCKECGKCVEACPTQALKFVQSDEAALLRKKGKIGVFPVPIIRR
ncbi:MAG: 4Fe-4S binding protein [Candidatus Bathyarchaeia archaeon]